MGRGAIHADYESICHCAIIHEASHKCARTSDNFYMIGKDSEPAEIRDASDNMWSLDNADSYTALCY